ncbi:PaaX family transcriptional regulator C-terminal domain-containing protein [Mesorhizobium sp. CAU 1741]|uniref:PaaX family transcriptional regulator n=1 Tax=Mesorhizobium sp. CAU 1741 TaxID=3140366 RepID=UPI00325B12F3
MSQADKPATAVLDALIDRLHEQGRLRVWSLVVTIFGDAIVPRGGRVALATLQEIIERLRIEPGALRTAMSRLASDRWVTRERQGRNSYFSLDAHGRHAFDLATRRIYAGAPPGWAGKWTVAIAPPGSSNGVDLASHGFVRVNGAVFLRAETEDATDARAELADMLVIHGESAEHPEAIRALWPAQEIAEAYLAFAASFAPLKEALNGGAVLRGIDAMAARTLLIHDWRRIVLRDPGLPAALLPADWPAEAARHTAGEIYARLATPSEDWLDKAELPPVADPARFATRWR